ncbi:MAG: hypothetical protein DWQ04_06270 [Chloroflexi bacterium]|nr:MAG: hypothetical protein DWQ04_06270 [Chloroflexota bacterium]
MNRMRSPIKFFTICLFCLVIVGGIHAQSSTPIFRDVSEAAGISATHRASWDELGPNKSNFTDGYMAIGQAWGDYDNDGWLDLFVTGNMDENVLYHNNQDGTFSVSSFSGQLNVPDVLTGGAVWVDYNNDGLRDLFMANYGKNALFRNSGEFGFINVSERAGVEDAGKATGSTWADYDGDGWLDFYVTNWSCYPKCDPLDNNQARDRLYHNNQDGTFTDVSGLLLYDKTLGAGFSATFSDYDGDGDADLYVVNDILKNPVGNVYWRNDGPGCNGWCWTDATVETGSFFLKHGMGIAVGDYDNDLDQDVYFADMVNPMVLMQNQGDGTFVDVADTANVAVGPSSAVGWGTGFFDYDNDGWLDLYLATTEFIQESTALGAEGMHFTYPNFFFENNRDGTFTDVSTTVWADPSAPTMGFAYADYDNDGRIDYVEGNWNEGFALYRNESQAGQDNHWLTIRLVGTFPINRDAVGAKVTVVDSNGRSQFQEVLSGSSIGSGNDTALYFGLGQATAAKVTVVWPDGRSQEFTDVPTDQIWYANYFESFKDVSQTAGIEAAHSGFWDMFNPEFASGYLGIGQSWADYNQDGWVDLYVSGNLEGNVLFENNQDGTFRVSDLSESVKLPELKTGGTVWADYDNDSWPDLYVLAHGRNVLFRNERGKRLVDVTDAAGVGDGGKGSSATWGDYDSDGYLDLYVVNWACYPECEPLDPKQAQDKLYRNNGDGTFNDVSHLLVYEKLLGAGFTASFVDYDDDDDADIYVVNDALKNPIGNVMWRNDGPGCGGWCWADASVETGTDTLIDGMGLAIGDYDNDLDLDFYYTNMVNPMMLMTNEDGKFVDVAPQAGVEVGPSNAVGWGTAFFDYDNDGWQDLYLATTGFLQTSLDVAPEGMHFGHTDYLFKNTGDGDFADVTPPNWGLNPIPSMGFAYADYDNDGLTDFVVGKWNEGYALYRNQVDSDNNWLTVRLVGGGAVNRDAVGARVYVQASNGRSQMQEVKCGSSLGAGNELPLHFGLDQADIELVVVKWPDGKIVEYDNVEANQMWTVQYRSLFERMLPTIGIVTLFLVGIVSLGFYNVNLHISGKKPTRSRFMRWLLKWKVVTAVTLFIWSLYSMIKLPFSTAASGIRKTYIRWFAQSKPSTFMSVARWLDVNINLTTILFFFWALFWLLNGGDKFFNGVYVGNTEDWSAKGVLVDDSGEIALTLHPMETTGFYGVNRDKKMINYFENLGLPKEVAVVFLYGIAIAEIILGFIFFSLLAWNLQPPNKRLKVGLFADRTVHHLAFKGGLLIFVMFTIGDTLFGDRVELWEHSTFLILGLLSYYIWSQLDRKGAMQSESSRESAEFHM